jgi:hypothetical protein
MYGAGVASRCLVEKRSESRAGLERYRIAQTAIERVVAFCVVISVADQVDLGEGHLLLHALGVGEVPGRILLLSPDIPSPGTMTL